MTRTNPEGPLTPTEKAFEAENARLAAENRELREEIARLSAGQPKSPAQPQRDPDAYAKGRERALAKMAARRPSVGPGGNGSYVTYN